MISPSSPSQQKLNPAINQTHKAPKTQLTIKKIVFIALSVVGATFAATAILAFTASFLSFAGLTAFSLIALKVSACVAGLAFGSFGIVKLTDYLAPKLTRPLAVVANAIHAAITETFSFLTAVFTYFINLEKRNPTKVENSQKPILLIHGFMHNSSAWINYRKRLMEANCGPVFTINLGQPFASIDKHADKVRQQVDVIRKVTGRNDLMLICHSMGGLVGAKYALDLSSDTKVTDLVTIGTPWEGTYAAYLGLGKDAKEMTHGCSYVQDLNTRISETSIRRLYIASETDEIILPPRSALLSSDQGAERLPIQNLGHLGILYSDHIADKICTQYAKNIIPA